MRVFLILLWAASVIYGKAEYLPINWTEAAIKGLAYESHYEEPSVTPLAPCPCDLRMNHCDVSCCCDKDCSPQQSTAFSCIGGLKGGEKTDKHIDNNCKYKGPYSPEWHDFLCYVAENNPYLGLFFKNQMALINYQKYLDRVKAPPYTYEDNHIHTQEEVFYPYYTHGAAIETVITVEDSLRKGFLSVPYPVLYGSCIDQVPVHFLEDSNHECITRLSPEICMTDQTLSSEFYLQETEPSGDATLQVIANLTSQEVVNATITYSCMENISGFIKQQSKHRSKAAQYPEIYSSSPSIKCAGGQRPSYNESSHMCHNVVLKVSYDIQWNGSLISEVKGNVVMGSVPTSAQPPPRYIHQNVQPFIISANSAVYLTQKFEINFHHAGNLSMSIDSNELVNVTFENGTGITEDIASAPNITERSGNPGYQRGKPLLAGYAIYNDTEDSTSDSLLYVDINDQTGLYIWDSASSQNCLEEKLEAVLFGIDIISGCQYSWSNINTCEELNFQSKSMLSSLVRGDVVSQFGWPNVTTESDFLPVIWDISSHVLQASPTCQVPVAIEYEVVYRDVVDIETNDITVYQVLGCHVRFHYKEVTFIPNVTLDSLYLMTSVKFVNSPKPSHLSRFWLAMEDRWCQGGICWHECFWPWTHMSFSGGWTATQSLWSDNLMNVIVNTLAAVVASLPILTLIIAHSYHLTV